MLTLMLATCLFNVIVLYIASLQVVPTMLLTRPIVYPITLIVIYILMNTLRHIGKK